MKLPPKKKRANEARDITRPIEAALNRLPGVRCSRNNTGTLRDLRGIPVTYGLGLGGADIVGIVRVWLGKEDRDTGGDGLGIYVGGMFIGRAFALETKGSSRTKRSRKEDQARWGRVFRMMGGFYAIARSIPEAVAAVDRCRAGESE